VSKHANSELLWIVSPIFSRQSLTEDNIDKAVGETWLNHNTRSYEPMIQLTLQNFGPFGSDNLLRERPLILISKSCLLIMLPAVLWFHLSLLVVVLAKQLRRRWKIKYDAAPDQTQQRWVYMYQELPGTRQHAYYVPMKPAVLQVFEMQRMGVDPKELTEERLKRSHSV
jgi:hypothetical protein